MPEEPPVYKVVVLGDGAVGKTAFTLQLVSQAFVGIYDPTIEEKYHKQLVVDGRRCVVEILDTAGQEEYSAFREMWIRESEAFILMYSVTSATSWEGVRGWLQQIRAVREQVTKKAGLPPPASLSEVTCIVGSKTDDVGKRTISTQEGFALARELGCPFFECSNFIYDQVEAPIVEVIRKLELQRAKINKVDAIKAEVAKMEAEIRPSPKSLHESLGRFLSFRFRKGGARPLVSQPQSLTYSTARLPQQVLLSQMMVQAVRLNKTAEVRRLLAMGADPNDIAGVESSPLSTAAALGYGKMAALLLSHGAAINARDARGATALVLAASEGHLAVVKLLAEQGAQINALSNIQGTALIAATFRGHAKIVSYLVQQGADVNARGSQYTTALHTAAVVGKEGMVRMLLDAGADSTSRDEENRSALYLASSLGHVAVVQLLLLRGSTAIINEVHVKYGSALDAAYASSQFAVAKVLLHFGAKESLNPTSTVSVAMTSGVEHEDIGPPSDRSGIVTTLLSSSTGRVSARSSKPMPSDSARPSHRDDFKIAIICALPHEADAVEAVFDCCWDGDTEQYGKAEGDTNAYTMGKMGRHPVVLVHMPSIGKGAASSVASNVRNSFKNIELALVVGICGAAPLTPSHEEILLGDVVISDGIIQYDLGRRLPHTFIRKDTLLDNLGRPNPRIRSHLAKLRGRRSRVQLQEELILHLTELQERWPDQSLESPGIEQDQLFQSTYHHQHHQTPCSVCATNMIEDCKDRAICQEALHMTCDELVCDPKMAIPRIRHQVALHGDGTLTPRVHYGLIASGDSVIRSGVDRDILVARDGVIAFEMEGAGVWDNLPCIVIKAACDYADSHKNKHWQNYAAATAAACTKAFLQAWVANDSSTTLE